MSTDNCCFRGTMETHLAFVFIMWPKSQTEERWAADSLPRCGLRTREGASAVSTHVHPLCPGASGQHTRPPPVPGGSGSAHTSTSCPWGATGQDTRPPPVPGREGAPSRELHRARLEDMDAAPEGQGHRPTFFHS